MTMKVQMTNKKGQSYNGSEVKNILVCEDSGTPLTIIKETIIDGVRNYRILTPEHKEFIALTKALGFDVELIR